MNEIQQYDKNRAAEELLRQMNLRMENPHAIRCAANVVEDEEWLMSYQSIKYGSVWRFVLSLEENAVEEGILSFQGVLYKKDIAPFNPKNFHEKPNSGRFLRQSLTLCGLKVPLFQKTVDAVLGIHALLARSVGQDEMENCSMVSLDDDGEPLLHMSSRYLTPKRESNGMVVMPIPANVDPQGHLARIAGNMFVYTDDNHVRYFELRKAPGTDDTRFEECSPVIFRAGDIVEAQATFIIVNLRDGKKKTSMVLRSLLLLDGTITQKSMVAQILQRDEAVKVDRPLKRRVGYEDDDGMSKTRFTHDDNSTPRLTIRRKVGYIHESVSDATKRMSDMEIEDTVIAEGSSNGQNKCQNEKVTST